MIGKIQLVYYVTVSSILITSKFIDGMLLSSRRS